MSQHLTRPLDGGRGEVRLVATAFCPACRDMPPLVRYGTPIYDDEIIEL